MRRIFLVLMLSMSMAIAACASNSASGGGSSNDVKVLNGCKVDAARICNSIRGQSVNESNTGLEADSARLEQNSARTANIIVPVNNPKGDEIFEVECGMNTQQQSVSWASIKTGPPVSDDDATYLRGAGYCSEP